MQTLTSKEMKHFWLERQQLRRDNPELFALVSTGLKGWDNILGGGVEYGQMLVVGGAQKSGKSTLLLHLAKTWAQQGINFLWCGAEMTNMQIGTMLFSNISGISRTKIRAIDITISDWSELLVAGEEIEDYSGYWNYGFATMGDIYKTIKEVEEKHDTRIKAILIDYLQLMDAPEAGRNRTDQLAFLSRSMKKLTVNRKEPMIVAVAAQLNRESIRGHIVDANAFLGSGAIERDMDIGVIVDPIKDEYTPGQYLPNKKKIVVVGSRETAVDNCDVFFDGATATFDDLREETETVSIDRYRQIVGDN